MLLAKQGSKEARKKKRNQEFISHRKTPQNERCECTKEERGDNRGEREGERERER